MITYNHEPYIAQAIEGVLKQDTDFPFELVIGEDCSTDETREIVFDYQKKYPDIIRVITSDKNVGAYKNDIRTEKACRGKYVAYCDGDDYWHHPQKLQKQVDYLESHPECGLVHSDMDSLDVATGKRFESINKMVGLSIQDDINDYTGILEGVCPIYTCTVCVRRELLERAVELAHFVFQSSRFIQGDLPRWLEISRMSQLKYFDQSFSTYRILPESAMHSKSILKRFCAMLSAMRLRMYYMDKYGCSAKTRSQIVIRYNNVLLNVAFYSKDSKVANKARTELVRMGCKLSLSQLLKYWGTRNSLLYSLLKLGIYLRSSFPDRPQQII